MIKRLLSHEYDGWKGRLREHKADKDDPSIIHSRIIVKRMARLLKKINRLLYGEYTLKIYKSLDEVDIIYGWKSS